VCSARTRVGRPKPSLAPSSCRRGGAGSGCRRRAERRDAGPMHCIDGPSTVAGQQRYPVATRRIPVAVTTTFATVCGSESGRPARLASRFQGAPMRIQSGPSAKRRDSPGSSAPSKRLLPRSLRWRTQSQQRPRVARRTRVGAAGFVARLARPVVARAVRGLTGCGVSKPCSACKIAILRDANRVLTPHTAEQAGARLDAARTQTAGDP
jgi:hypothetical protein